MAGFSPAVLPENPRWTWVFGQAIEIHHLF
jgi:hypothetical protein